MNKLERKEEKRKGKKSEKQIIKRKENQRR